MEPQKVGFLAGVSVFDFLGVVATGLARLNAWSEIDFDERPVPVSYAKHKVETSMSEHVMNLENSNESTTTQITDKRMPLRTDTQRPRLVGPPIRRPRPKPKGSSSSAGGTYKSGPTGTGNCPPGNEATRDDSGRLIMCNGFEPNCPPRSYCYITTGGFASEEYNCCKSW
uniref:C. briggsae CBR-LGX-1 protein n=1 Tax=Haemonchus contortus TaxID=6289 RepID=W6NET1_HAECO